MMIDAAFGEEGVGLIVDGWHELDGKLHVYLDRYELIESELSCESVDELQALLVRYGAFKEHAERLANKLWTDFRVAIAANESS